MAEYEFPQLLVHELDPTCRSGGCLGCSQNIALQTMENILILNANLVKGLQLFEKFM